MRSPARRNEGGFTLVELIVVVIIVGILFAAVLPQLNRTRRNTGAPTVNVAAAAIWRGVQNYRIDNNGAFPPVTMLQNPTTFRDVGGVRYVKRWPQDTRGTPMPVSSGSGAPPSTNLPMSAPGTLAGTVVYFPSGTSGWLVAYSDTGAIVFRREVGNWDTRPAG